MRDVITDAYGDDAYIPFDESNFERFFAASVVDLEEGRNRDVLLGSKASDEAYSATIGWLIHQLAWIRFRKYQWCVESSGFFPDCKLHLRTR